MSLRVSLLVYRTLAYVVGTLLVVLVFIGIPLQLGADNDSVVRVVGTAHGILFIGYLISVLELGIRCRWHPARIVLTMSAGVIPFLSFVLERQVRRDVQRRGLLSPPPEAEPVTR